MKETRLTVEEWHFDRSELRDMIARLHFSMGANIFYDNADELLIELQEVRDRIRDSNQSKEET